MKLFEYFKKGWLYSLISIILLYILCFGLTNFLEEGYKPDIHRFLNETGLKSLYWALSDGLFSSIICFPIIILLFLSLSVLLGIINTKLKPSLFQKFLLMLIGFIIMLIIEIILGFIPALHIRT